MDMLTLSHVSKSFGSKKIIDDLSFTVPEHCVYGFIGQNGAGKTTTMKMILGLLQTDSGTIKVNGETVRYGQNRTNRYMGYLPDVPEFYGYMTPSEYLKLCGEITGMSSAGIRKKSDELLHLVGLDKENKPKLLICDEPTSALDPLGRKEILDILLSVKDHTTVVFSTHILSDVERICDEIALLHNGRTALKGTLEEIKSRRKGNGFDIEFYTPQDADAFAASMSGSERISAVRLFFPGKDEKDMTHAMKILADNALCVQKVEMREATLENLFMEVIGI